MHDFERRSGMPFVAGAVDGSHIPIVVQREVSVAHYCYKQFTSFILHIMCNARYALFVLQHLESLNLCVVLCCVFFPACAYFTYQPVPLG